MDYTPIIIALLSFLGGGGVLHLWRYWRRDAAAIVKEETDAYKELKNLAEQSVSAKFEEERQRMVVAQKLENAELLIKIKDGIISRYENNFKEIFIEQGASKEREQRCQQEMELIKAELVKLNANNGGMS